jgi:hypothetical protein
MAGTIDGTNLDELVPRLIANREYQIQYHLVHDPRTCTLNLLIRAVSCNPGTNHEPQYGLMLEGGWHIVAQGDRFPAFDIRSDDDRTFSEWHEGATEYAKIRKELDLAILAKNEYRERLEAMERRFDTTIATISTVANNS